MGFQDVAFLSTRSSFSTTFHKNCGIVESLRTTTYPKTVVVGKQGHAACKTPCSNKSSFCVSRISLRSQDCHEDDVNQVTLSFLDITGCKIMVSVCLKLCYVIYKTK